MAAAAEDEEQQLGDNVGSDAGSDMADFLGDFGADSEDGELPEEALSAERLPQPQPEPEPEPEPEPKRRRVSVCLGLAPADAWDLRAVEAAARAAQWPERSLQWHGAKQPSAGCGFASKDMYTEFSKDLTQSLEQLPGWLWLDGSDAAAPSEQQPHPEYLAICCSLESDKAEREGPLVTALMEQLAPQLTAKKSSSGGDDDGATTHVARGIRPLLVSEATKIPLVPLPRGLSGFTASEDTVDTTAAMLEESGICIYPAALTEQDTTALARLAMIRTAQVERALASGVEANPRGTVIGSGDVTFAEICSRGVQRWDMLLHPPGGAISTSSRFLTIWSLDPCFLPDFWADTIHLVGNG